MQGGKHVILCVDDDQDVLDILRTTLEANGYVMLEASSAEEGLKRYQESPPDLLIIDLMMEEIDAGVSLVKDLRALGAKQPVYMLSSVGDELNLNVDSNTLGLSGVFQKPLNTTSLLRILKTKLG